MRANSPGKKSAQAHAQTESNGFLIGGGAMGAAIRSYEWSKTSLGTIDSWPEHLQTAVSIMLNSSFPMFIWWDKKELINFYNDVYRDILGDKHPAALGRPANKVWSEIWRDLKPYVDEVFELGKSVYVKDMRMVLNRRGYDEETFFTFSYTPLRNNQGKVEGLFCAVTETTEEVNARQRLQESENRFRSLADTAPMYIAMADEAGRAVYFNKPWLDFTGKKMSEMKGMGWLSTVHPEDAANFERDFKEAFQKQIPINKEYRFKRADGEYRWMLAIGAPRFTPDGHFSGYFGTYTDFHELKEAQLAMQESEERFRTLIEKSTDVVQMVSAEGDILFTSDSIENVLGYTAEEMAHKGVTPFIHPDDIDYFFSQFQSLIDNPDKQIVMQYRVKHRDGSWAWIETVGVNHLETPYIRALVGNFRNITEQKEAEAKLQHSEARFRALADNIPNLAWMADADGVPHWYNNRWYEYTGKTLERMEEEGWQSVIKPDYAPAVLQEYQYSIKTGKPFEMVYPMRAADGSFKPFLTRAVPLHTEDGKIKQWIGTNTDISDQIKDQQIEARNEELEKITKQLAVQRKQLISINKAKDEFIGMASHQLRTPATAVKQYIGLLRDQFFGPLNSEQLNYLQVAYDSNERELEIINDLLKTAQIDATEYSLNQKPHDIVNLVTEALSHLAPMFELRNQQVSLTKPDQRITVLLDATEMKLVFVNLLENASKYSYPGAKIKVTIRQTKKCVAVDIIDKGVGISKENQERIFEKFTRVDNELSDTVTGTGLGLYWVKQLVGMHRGSVKLTSELGKGSKFTVRLPYE